MSDAYAWWRNSLKGDFGPIHDSEPQCGFYRKPKYKGGPFEPVAIWIADLTTGLMVALVGDRQVDAEDVWTFCCRQPVTEEVYRKAVETGQWDDEPPAIERGIGDNLPDDPFEALAIEFTAEKELAESFLKTPVTTQEQANKAAVWAKKIAAIAKKATDLHKVEKQPHLDAGRAIDNKWRDLKEEPKALSDQLKAHLNAWLREQDRLEKERQRKLAEEAEAKRREAEELLAKQDIACDNSQAEMLLSEAQEKEKEAAKTQNANAGRTGAKVALRTFISAKIVDYDKALIALKDHPEMKDLVNRLADRAVKAGHILDGIEKIEEKRAV